VDQTKNERQETLLALKIDKEKNSTHIKTHPLHTPF
jgi:hypothetical protein